MTSIKFNNFYNNIFLFGADLQLLIFILCIKIFFPMT